MSIRALKLSNFDRFRTLNSPIGFYDFRALNSPIGFYDFRALKLSKRATEPVYLYKVFTYSHGLCWFAIFKFLSARKVG